MTSSNLRASCLLAGALATLGCGGAGSTLASGADAGGDGGSGSTTGGDGGVVSNGGSPGDAGPGGNAQSLPCGTTSCAIPGQACCVYDPTAFLCVSGSACPVLDAGAGARAGTGLTCSGAANCPASTVCCVYENASKQVVSSCLAACPSGGAQLCDPSAASSGCAADAGACSSNNVTDWNIPNTYATCGGIGN